MKKNIVIKEKEGNSKCEVQTNKERIGHLDIQKKVLSRHQAPVERMQSTFSTCM